MSNTSEPAPPAGGSQRIDKWLWYTRAIKSRTLAAELVTEGKVRVNRTRVEKPSHLVKPGDVLTIAIGSHIRVLEVRAPGVRRGPASEAQTLYADLTPPAPPRDHALEGEHAGGREPGSGRPTKRERRLTDRLQEGD